jgi:hypothetical protein
MEVLCLAPVESGRIRKNLEIPERLAQVSGRFARGFWNGIHFADHKSQRCVHFLIVAIPITLYTVQKLNTIFTITASNDIHLQQNFYE